MIRGNRLDATGTNAVGVGGIYVRFDDGAQIDHNVIKNLSTPLVVPNPIASDHFCSGESSRA